jgi:hypothetical protein
VIYENDAIFSRVPINDSSPTEHEAVLMAYEDGNISRVETGATPLQKGETDAKVRSHR